MSLGVEVGGWFASACVGKLVDTVCSYISDQYAYEANVKDKLKCIADDLTKILCVLHEADKRRIQNPALQQWLWDIKDAASEADDIFDMFEYKILEDKVEKTLNQVGSTFLRLTKRPRTVAKRFLFSDNELIELNDVVVKFRKIISDMVQLIQLISLEPTIKENVHEIMQSRETTSMCTEPQLFGRDEETSDIIEKLLEVNSNDGRSTSKNVTILTIVGIGGVGKTALAQDVYSNQNVKGHFGLKAWVCVSDDFDVKRIAKEIIESACILYPEKVYNLQNLDSIQEILKCGLTRKKFLIVLDDVWNEEARKWEVLQAILNFGEKGSRVIVTTRSQKTADTMGTGACITLGGLPGKDYWKLFVQCAFGDDDSKNYPSLESIGRQIAKKLGGNPLAAKVVGSVLKCDLNVRHWREVLENNWWQVDQQKGGIMSVLRLSYDYLPVHLRQCFIYCSLFPKDYRFEVSKLVRLWMAQGFLQSHEEDIGVKYFDELFCRSFFQKTKYSSHRYVIHDLLYDLAKELSRGEILDISENKPIKNPKMVRHIYVGANNLSLVCNNEYLKKKLRSLVVSSLSNNPVEFLSTKNNPLEMLKELKGLRVLILDGFKWGLLADSIFEEMVHLRYIEIKVYENSYSNHKLPKSLGMLLHIQVLSVKDLRGDNVDAVLPGELSRLSNLRHLDGDTRGFAGIGTLTLLHNLCFSVKLREDGFEMRQLGDMKELRRLEIKGLESVGSKQEACEAILENKERLKELSLDWRVDGNHGGDYDDVGIANKEEVLEGFRPHPHNLEKLNIYNYNGRRSPSWWNESWASCSNLQKIELQYCKNWEVLPPFGLLPHLKHLNLHRMNGVKRMGTEVYGSCNNNDDNIIIVFPSLETLQLSVMPELMELWKVEEGDENAKIELFPHLSCLYISACLKLRGLHWWNESWASSCSCLQKITLDGCPNWEVLPPFGLLPHLKYLRLAGMKGVKRMGTESYGSGSGSGNNNDNSMIVFPSLETLILFEMQELTELWNVESFPRLSSLHIDICPKLRGPLFLQSQLKVLRVAIGGFFHKFPRGGICLGCKDVSSLIEWVPLQNLSSVEKFTFSLEEGKEMRRVTGLPAELREWFQHLTSLRSLSFLDCWDLQCLPSNLLNSLSSTLQELSFVHCGSMESLPEEGLPTSLQLLTIEYCSDELMEGCSYNGREWHKISHISTIIINRRYVQQQQRSPTEQNLVMTASTSCST